MNAHLPPKDSYLAGSDKAMEAYGELCYREGLWKATGALKRMHVAITMTRGNKPCYNNEQLAKILENEQKQLDELVADLDVQIKGMEAWLKKRP